MVDNGVQMHTKTAHRDGTVNTPRIGSPVYMQGGVSGHPETHVCAEVFGFTDKQLQPFSP